MEDQKRETFGLCLSGGGFRATLYHLGVVRLLRDAGRLREVTHVCSVSGGSILAAHLVLNWERYNGGAEEFDAAAEEVVRLVRSDLRGQVVRRWLLSWLLVAPRPLRWLRRRRELRITSLLEGRYAEFYGGKTLAALDDLAGGRPELHLLSTSMTTGHLCSFSRHGFSSGDGRGQHREIAASELPVSLAVAASSAFPPLFPPVALTREMLQCEEREFPHTEYLADGGVYDNLGLRKLLLLRQEKGIAFDSVFVSDAGTKLDSQTGVAFTFVVGRSIRASDLLMMRVGDMEYKELDEMRTAGGAAVAYCRIQDVVTGRNAHVLSPEKQRAVKGIRTDLDQFDGWEVNILVQHGYATARKALAVAVADDAPPPWLPPSTRGEWDPARPNSREIGRAKKHRWRVWAANDWRSWLSLLMLLVLSVPLWAPSLLSYRRAQLSALEKAVAEQNLLRADEARAAAERAAQEMEVEKAESDDDKEKAVEGLLDLAVKDAGPEISTSGGREPVRAVLGSIFDDYKPAVVRVTSGSGVIASGFFVGEEGYILTADYVVGTEQTPEHRRANSFKVRTVDGAELPARLVVYSTSERLALLKTDGAAPRTLALADAPPRVGAPVLSAGYFEGRALLPEVAVVSGLTEWSLKLTLRSGERTDSGGFGGGPVLNAAGEAVGIYYASSAAGLRECVRADVARRFVRQHLPGFDDAR